jgi:hypothetical protein
MKAKFNGKKGGVQNEYKEEDEQAVGRNQEKRHGKVSPAESGACTNRSLVGTH